MCDRVVESVYMCERVTVSALYVLYIKMLLLLRRVYVCTVSAGVVERKSYIYIYICMLRKLIRISFLLSTVHGRSTGSDAGRRT